MAQPVYVVPVNNVLYFAIAVFSILWYFTMPLGTRFCRVYLTELFYFVFLPHHCRVILLTSLSCPQVSGHVNRPSVARVNREDVKTEHFLLADLPWSDWKTGVTSLPPNGRSRAQWERRHGDHVGVRNTQLFNGEIHRPSVYEVAVQPEPGAPKYPVACAVTSGFQQRNWDRVVLKDYAHHQVDRVLQRGCKLMVRRASIRPNKKSGGTVEDSMKELRSLIGRHYDYAWKCRYDVDSRTYPNRQLFRNDKMISDGACPVIYWVTDCTQDSAPEKRNTHLVQNMSDNSLFIDFLQCFIVTNYMYDWKFVTWCMKRAAFL